MLRRLLARLRPSAADAEAVWIEREITAREKEALAAPVQRRAALWNQAGDLCLKDGEYERARLNFGRAIDAYLESGFLEAAPALCRKVIRLSPEVIRARGTLAAVFLAQGLFTDAERQIEDYVRAAEAAEQEELAVRRLRLIAAATESHHVRLRIGEHLLTLDDPIAADRVFGTVFAERNGLRPRLSSDDDERWGRLLPVVLLGPADLIELGVTPLLS